MSALDKQIDGDHYKKMKIQTTEFCMANNLDHCQSNVVKYVCRHADKDGVKDLKKAIHYLEMLIHFKYEENKANETCEVPTVPIKEESISERELRCRESNIRRYDERVAKDTKSIGGIGYGIRGDEL